MYFEDTVRVIDNALKSIDLETFERLIEECHNAIASGNKVIVSGLGKNVPICEKFVGTMISLGMNANFLHTNSAIHGDIGSVKAGDIVVVLSKSGTTIESIHLIELLLKRTGVNVWVLTFEEKCEATKMVGINKSVRIKLEHEGDLWNIVPNNSTTINLIVLQTLVIQLAQRMNVSLQVFKENHPGGAIGERLRDA